MAIETARPVRIHTSSGEVFSGLDCEGMLVGGSWAGGLEEVRKEPRTDHASIAQFLAATALPNANL